MFKSSVRIGDAFSACAISKLFAPVHYTTDSKISSFLKNSLCTRSFRLDSKILTHLLDAQASLSRSRYGMLPVSPFLALVKGMLTHSAAIFTKMNKQFRQTKYV